MKDKKACLLWRFAGSLWMLSSIAYAVKGDWSMFSMNMSVGAMNIAVGQQYA